MKNITVMLIFFMFLNSLGACSTLTDESASNVTEWDFDHHLQFIKTPLNKNMFQLEIIRNNNVGFKQMAAFLLRKSYLICGGYSYKLEIIQGVEGFDDKRAMPNYIPRSLIAKIECE